MLLISIHLERLTPVAVQCHIKNIKQITSLQHSPQKKKLKLNDNVLRHGRLMNKTIWGHCWGSPGGLACQRLPRAAKGLTLSVVKSHFYLAAQQPDRIVRCLRKRIIGLEVLRLCANCFGGIAAIVVPYFGHRRRGRAGSLLKLDNPNAVGWVEGIR